MPFTARFRSVNGHRLAQYRIYLGWSQRDLARRAGYSERLVRKAESGGSLSMSTIRDLADALSCDGHVIKFQQLLVDYISIARAFMEAYDSHGIKMIPHCKHFLSSNVTMCCPADPKQVSFAGEWQGLSGLETYLQNFFSQFNRTYHSGPPAFLTGEERVSARYYDRFNYSGKEFPPIWVHRHFHFEDDLVVRINDEFDTRMFSAFISSSGKTLRT